MNGPLSLPATSMQDRYGVVVVGSGYGGSIMAARLADVGYDVCLLERGREWRASEFPDTKDAVLGAMRGERKPYGLYDYRRNDDVDVLVGCGLGGTSLINAGVAIEPEPAVFNHPAWPGPIRQLGFAGLGPYFQRVRERLAVAKATANLRKSSAHRRSALGQPGRFGLLDVAVNFDRYDNQNNADGVLQQKCTSCGDCLTGCNVRAKNTLDYNYLPLAQKSGAKIFTGAEVEFLWNLPSGGYGVHCRVYDQDSREAGNRTIHCHAVVLAAGALGSPKILLRSRDRGLPLSDRLGYSFSANGDILGFGYNNDVRTDVLGFGNHTDDRSRIKVGPLITSVIDYRQSMGIDRGVLIEEGCIPRALVDLLRRFLPGAAAVAGHDTDTGFADEVREEARKLRDLGILVDPEGALNHSMVYLGMGHDGADGVLSLDAAGRVRVHWPTAPENPVFKRIADEMHELTRQLGGTALRNEPWVPVIGGKVVTVHPLGGCAMGENADSGVVDHAGQVFDSKTGGVHKGLYVVDGSIIPTSVGANPLLTISALAERAAELFIAGQDSGKQPPTSAPSVPAPAVPVGLEFTEEMAGHVDFATTDAKDPADYVAAERLGKRRGNGLSFKVTIIIDDVALFIREPDHQARLIGSINLLGKHSMLAGGQFNLFADTGDPSTKQMLYGLPFADDSGQKLRLDGFKTLRDDPGLDPMEVWRDATTLYVSLRRVDPPNDPVIAQGVVRISMAAFLAQLTTFRARNARDLAAASQAKQEFLEFFSQSLWDLYFKHVDV